MLSNSGVNVEDIYPSLLKFFSTQDYLLKKQICSFISGHGNNNEVVLMTLGLLTSDANGPNALHRALALDTLLNMEGGYCVFFDHRE